MNDATNNDDLEIAARARYLLKMIHVEWSVESDPPEVKKLLQDYETVQSRIGPGRCTVWLT